MRHLCVWTISAAMLAGAAHAAPQSESESDKAPSWEEQLEEKGEAFKESLDSLLGMLEGVVSAIPQYEAPEMLENGDIIIRRKDSEEPKKKEEEPVEEGGTIET